MAGSQTPAVAHAAEALLHQGRLSLRHSPMERPLPEGRPPGHSRDAPQPPGFGDAAGQGRTVHDRLNRTTRAGLPQTQHDCSHGSCLRTGETAEIADTRIDSRVTPDGAFLLLAVASMNVNRRLRHVADDLVRSGELPAAAQRGRSQASRGQRFDESPRRGNLGRLRGSRSVHRRVQPWSGSPAVEPGPTGPPPFLQSTSPHQEPRRERRGVGAPGTCPGRPIGTT